MCVILRVRVNNLSDMQSSDEDGAAERGTALYGVAFFASLLYVVLTFAAPQTDNAFDLGPQMLVFLKGTIALPYVLTWFSAAYGLSALGRYVGEARGESPAVLALLRSFRDGLLWLASGTVCVALVGAIKPFLPETANAVSLVTILTNYLYVFPQLIGFLVIYRGVVRLQSSKEVPGLPPISCTLRSFPKRRSTWVPRS